MNRQARTAKRVTVKAKLITNAVIGIALALFLVSIASAALDFFLGRAQVERDLRSKTSVLAYITSGPLMFENPADAAERLQSLKQDPDIVLARVFDAKGGIFATYSSGGDVESIVSWIAEKRSNLFPATVTVDESVLEDDVYYGRVELTLDLRSFYTHLLRKLALAGVALLVSLAVALVLANRLQRKIVDPIQNLARASGRIVEEQDFAVRAAKISEDEIGVLTDSFNQMLLFIQKRDRELKNSRDQLEIRVRDRTRDLEEAKRTAETANRAKSDFLSNMSHELRTPLTAIIGYSEILIDSDSPEEETHEYLETIRRNGNQLLELINEVLDLAKIEAGRIEVELLRTSPTQVVEEAMGLLQPKALEQCVELSSSYEDMLPRLIVTDPMRLRQILINLIGNAVKFTNDGAVEVTTTLLESNDSEPLLRIAIKDSGIGIREDQLESLFLPFTQADSSMTRKFGGTGLGLAISHEMAGLLGGTIEVESVEGEGSTFTVTVSTGSLEGVQRVPVAKQGSSSRKEQRPASTITLEGSILVAEDGPDNQRLITHLLEKAGARVTMVENGKLAVEAALDARAQDESFDLILMDIQMPVMNGYEATRKLRAEGLSEPIIALSAHAMTGHRTKCLDAGCTDYCSKPIDRALLLGILQKWLKQPHSTT